MEDNLNCSPDTVLVKLEGTITKERCKDGIVGQGGEYQRGGLAYRTEVVDLLPGIQTVNCERFAIELRSIHEEADIRVALQTGFCTRTGSYKTTPNVLDKVISITKLPDRLPPSIVNSIAFLHCFTGCDILSFIFFKEKQTILRAVLPWLPRISALAQMILEEIDRVVELEEDEAVLRVVFCLAYMPHDEEEQPAKLRTVTKGSSLRIITARFAGNNAKLTLVACYAPTNDADDVTKDSFYNTLQAVAKDIPSHDLTCVAGDFNAKVGNDKSYCPEVLGSKGLGEINENGTLLVDFALTNDLIIRGTIFAHKTIHKYSWSSPDGRTHNQIDHLLINRKWKSSLQDVRAFRAADVASDHALMIARISLKLKAAPKTSPKANPAFDSAKRSTPAIRNVFALTLSNKFEALALDDDIDASLESTWNTIKEVYSQTAAATVGYAKRPKDQWLSERTWNLIGDRRNLKQQLLNGGEYNNTVLKNQLYRDLDKLVKKSARGDKRNLLEEKAAMVEETAAMAEEAAKRGDSRAIYKITNEIVGKSRNVNGPVKDASGKTVTYPSEITEVWALHFEKVLNGPRPLDPPDIPVTPCLNLQISTEEPSDVEISQAGCKLKNGRAAGTDRISAEMIKASLSVCMTVWLTLFASIWTSEKVPDDWTESTLIRLFKKGDATKCENWRGISLISTPGKLFAQIILRRIQTALDSHLRDEQHGFRPSRSCTDLIYVLRMMIEESNEWRQKCT
ncbi:uncharacterized protein LOC136041763 [Artemia franciscana]|uniref:uncharacterized protein LOC136041763 n=1 Tax=Artemia franciscana TaxID=6661 RepID=UPI0032DB6CAD